MKKPFMGVRLKRLREERRLTQQALASAIGISLSYLNQLENNQRPLTLPVVLKLNAAFGVDIQLFSEDEEARLVADLLEYLFTHNRDALWLVLEEADAFAPQQPMGELTRVLGEVDRIARRGRNFGFRLISITQRPASPTPTRLSPTFIATAIWSRRWWAWSAFASSVTAASAPRN